jgi:hypothetical protein
MIGAAPEGELPALTELESQLARMRADGELDTASEGVLHRHFAERAGTLAVEFDALLSEYRQRAETDGEEAAMQWLAEAAESLGRRDGEETRRILASVATAQ